jgi:prepilin signal peptidase PulO-like enzyme (type II secretory pathway)
MSVTSSSRPYQQLSVLALGCGLSATLVALYVLCWLAVFILPDLTHGWLALFSTQPPGSLASLVGGIVLSALFGWIGAIVLGGVYNYVLERRR